MYQFVEVSARGQLMKQLKVKGYYCFVFFHISWLRYPPLIHHWTYHSLALLSNRLNDSCDSRGIRGGCGAGVSIALQWRHNKRDGVSNHRRLDCLLNRLFRRRSKKTSNFCVTGICEGNLQVTGEFPWQKASNAENVSIWWRHHCSATRMSNNSGSSS